MIRTMISLTALMLLFGFTLQRQLASIEGVVKNLQTGEVIAGAQISVISESFGPGGRTGTSDRDGKFNITGIAPGRYSIHATKTAFFRPRRNAGATLLTVSEGERLTGVQLLLSPTGVISGRAVNDRRETQPSVYIEALRPEYRDGVPAWALGAQTITNDRGEYRLFNLTPGMYYIRATQQNRPVSFYYPGFIDLDNAVPLAVEAGKEASGVDLELRSLKEYAVRLKIDSKLPAGASVNFTISRKSRRGEDLWRGRRENLSDNTYQFLMPSGNYEIGVSVRSDRVSKHVSVIPVVVGNADQDLGTVILVPTVALTGQLVPADPLSTVKVNRPTVILQRLEPSTGVSIFPLGRGGATPEIRSDGSFTLPGVLPGRYRVLLTGLPAGSHLISARIGLTEVLDTGFTINGEQSPVQLKIGGSASVGRIEGTIIDDLGKPITEGTVVLIPPADRRRNPNAFKTSTTDQHGNFSLPSVLPGEYKLLAFGDIEPGAYFDPDFLEKFETRAQSLQVRAGSQHTVTVRLIPVR